MTPGGPLVLGYGGVEPLASPLMSGNHAELSLLFVDFEVAWPPSWKERRVVSHRHNSLGAYLTIHAAKVIVVTPSQKWTKIKGWLNHPCRFLGKTQVKDNVATKMALDHELPTLLLTFKLCPSF